MHPFRLNIANPCPQDWNAMTGTEKQRHCASCNHEVVALAEMHPEEALALVRNAKPHSLCLRIEHDDLGNVMFRQTQAVAHAAPLLVLTLGASLLLTACNEAPPTAANANLEKDPTTQSLDATRAKTSDRTPSAPENKESVAPNPTSEKVVQPEPQVASSAAVQAVPGVDDRHAKPPNRTPVRVTTGCACAVGDRLCDCL